MAEFLDSFSKKSTMRMYKRSIDLFCEWYGKDIETILQERKDSLTPRPDENLVDAKQRASRYEKLLEKFYAWLPKGCLNKARDLQTGEFLQQYGSKITLGKVPLFQSSTEPHPYMEPPKPRKPTLVQRIVKAVTGD